MSIGEMIKKRRKRLHISAEQLAERIGKSPATVYRYESGDIDKVDSRVLLEIATALSTTPAYLMEMTDDPAAQFIDLGQSATDVSGDEAELLGLYRSVNAAGQTAILANARGVAATPEYKKGGLSSEITA